MKTKSKLSIATTLGNYERWGHKFKHFTILKGVLTFLYRGDNYRFVDIEKGWEFIREKTKETK